MKKNQIFIGIIITLIFAQIFLITFNDGEIKNFDKSYESNLDIIGTDREKDLPQLANSNITKALNFSSITRNTTTVSRVFQSINITVNVSAYLPENANFTRMYIRFFDGSIEPIDMNETAGGEKFTYTYTPDYTDPLGLARVNFTIYNATGLESEWKVLNNGTTYTNFTIKSISLAALNASIYDRGEFVFAPILVENPSEFTWDVSVVDNNYDTVFSLGKNLNNTYFPINESFDQPSAYYYLAINATQKASNKWEESYFKFQIQNANPVIVDDSLKFNPTEIFRTERCFVEVNVSDEESVFTDLTVSLNLEDPKGNTADYDYTFTYAENLGIFKTNFIISADSPAGYYNAEIRAEDENSGISIYETSLMIKNNPPKINSYQVNNFTMEEQVNINYGDDLTFKFNVTDKEGLSYVKVALLNEDNEWYNITREYKDNMRIIIRTEDLVSGDWYIYLYVTDSDGKTVGLDFDYDVAPQQINIIPDLMSIILPWISLIIGLAIGIIIGIAAGSRLGKSSEKQKGTPEKPKKVRSQKKIKKTPKPRPEKTKKKPQEAPKTEKIEEEKQEKKGKKPKRKIKRKL